MFFPHLHVKTNKNWNICDLYFCKVKSILLIVRILFSHNPFTPYNGDVCYFGSGYFLLHTSTESDEFVAQECPGQLVWVKKY